MAFEYYEGPGEIQFNGSTLAEATSVKVQYMSNSKPVITMAKGFSGVSRGPAQSRLSVENACPKAGMEDEFIEKCIAGEKVDIVVVFGGKRRTHQGVIDTVDTSSASDATGMVNFEVVAGPPKVL
jgi:hypothetical protein